MTLASSATSSQTLTSSHTLLITLSPLTTGIEVLGTFFTRSWLTGTYTLRITKLTLTFSGQASLDIM